MQRHFIPSDISLNLANFSMFIEKRYELMFEEFMRLLS